MSGHSYFTLTKALFPFLPPYRATPLQASASAPQLNAKGASSDSESAAPPPPKKRKRIELTTISSPHGEIERHKDITKASDKEGKAKDKLQPPHPPPPPPPPPPPAAPPKKPKKRAKVFIDDVDENDGGDGPTDTSTLDVTRGSPQKTRSPVKGEKAGGGKYASIQNPPLRSSK